MKVAVLGAGPGALVAALALRRMGIEVEVHGHDTPPEPAQALLALPPNASRILRALGLTDALAPYAAGVELVQMRSARSGYPVAWQARGGVMEARYGAPYLEIPAGALSTALRDAAATHQVRFAAARVARVDDIDAQWIVAAEVPPPRFCAGPRPESRPTPWQLYQGMSPAGALGEPGAGPPAEVWLGADSHFEHVRIGAAHYWSAIVPKHQHLNAALAGWAAPVAAQVAAAEVVTAREVRDFQPLPSWRAERLVLIGDACHPILPHPRIGTALAIEDGWVLAHMFDVYEEETASAALEFERHRKPRTDRVQAWARRYAADCHPGRTAARLWLNLALAVGCRFLPEIAVQRHDWLYGYDAVRHYG